MKSLICSSLLRQHSAHGSRGAAPVWCRPVGRISFYVYIIMPAIWYQAARARRMCGVDMAEAVYGSAHVRSACAGCTSQRLCMARAR